MAKKAFRLRLPQRAAIEMAVAEFPMTRSSDAALMARRARVLGALAAVPVKPRNDFAKAVAAACRLFAEAQIETRVQFGIGERERQTLVEVIISSVNDCDTKSDKDKVGANGRKTKKEDRTSNGDGFNNESLEKLKRLSQSLQHFELNDFPGSSAIAILAQATPTTLHVSRRDATHWAELLSARTLEDAIAIAEQDRRQAAVERDIATSRSPTAEAATQAAADRNDLETLSLVVSRATNAILIMDAGGVIQWTNDAFTSLTGYSSAEVIGQRLEELLFGPSTDLEAVREFHQAFRNGHELTQDVMQYHRDGRTFWVECKLIPVQDDHGQLSRWIAIQSDVTRRRQTEEALRAAKQAAENSSRTKSEFLANMSHEIRTPLNAILGMTELALTTDLTREQRDYLQTVQSSADTLLQLLNDVLDLSKIEAGKMELENVAFNLAEVVRETLKALAVRAHEKELELAVHMPMDIPQFFQGDPTRIRQVLFNLVGNAIKFTERGEVVVDVEEQWRTEDEVCLHFSVRDTGIGIPKERLQQIFDSFTQVDSSMARRFGGTGLGLTITSQLLQMMNGKIWVQSKQGKGSTFHFTINLKLSEEAPPTALAVDASELRGKQALVADDNSTNRRILDEMLRHWGVKPTLVEGAAAAIKELEDAARRDEPFDVVLLDAMMPVVDGFQLAEMIKQRPDLKCGAVMMLSSADRPNSAVRCRQLGIGAFLVKPVSASALLEALVAAVSAKTNVQPRDDQDEHEEVEIAHAAKPKRALRVLVADDHEPNRSLAIKILKRRGYDCEPAADGDEALAAWSQSSFDVVLMDVQMPGRDGFSATRAIREREKLTGSHTPIIALTAHALSGDREKCLSAGMDAYLAKPIHARELVAVVERVGGASPDKNDAEVKPTTPKPVRTSPFDISAALDRMDGELDLLKEHIGYVLKDVPQLVERMRDALQSNDGRQLAISAHRLKSLVSSYNHHEARELAQSLEMMGKEGDFTDADNKLHRLATLLEEFSDAVKHYLEQKKE